MGLAWDLRVRVPVKVRAPAIPGNVDNPVSLLSQKSREFAGGADVAGKTTADTYNRYLPAGQIDLHSNKQDRWLLYPHTRVPVGRLAGTKACELQILLSFPPTAERAFHALEVTLRDLCRKRYLHAQ